MTFNSINALFILNYSSGKPLWASRYPANSQIFSIVRTYSTNTESQCPEIDRSNVKESTGKFLEKDFLKSVGTLMLTGKADGNIRGIVMFFVEGEVM